MANSKVALLRYIRTARGWRRLRVHAIRRGRGWDESISPPEGAEILERGEFQLRWYRGGDAVYKGSDTIFRRRSRPATTKWLILRPSGRKMVAEVNLGC